MEQAKIQYWVGLLANQRTQDALTLEQKDVLERCLVNSKEVSFEKLKGYQNLYSIRYSVKGRILLTQAKDHLVVLAILPNHEYDKVLKRQKAGIWDRFASQIEDALDIQGNTLAAEDDSSISCTSSVDIPTPSYHPVALEFDSDNNPKVLVLDNHQQAAISTLLPAIISGLPGSGKTTVALALLNSAQGLGDEQKILYVAQSSGLVDAVKESFRKVVSKDDFSKVEFKTYHDLLHNLTSEQRVLTRKEGKEEIQQWLTDFLSDPRRQSHYSCTTSRINIETDSQMTQEGREKLYQEFRIRSGYDSADYCNPQKVGKKQSLFAESHKREWVDRAYKTFIAHLVRENLVMADFFSGSLLNVEEEAAVYETVLVDEAQDFSNRQIASLAKISVAGKNVCYFYGDGQSLQDNTPNRIFMKSMFGQTEVHSTTLMQPYRCSQSVIRVADVINQLRLRCTPKNKAGVALDLSKQSNDEIGSVQWVNTASNAESLTQICALIQHNPNACIITHADKKEEAMQKYGAEDYQVFTAEEIKGLQYKDVVIYEPWHDSIYKKIERKFSELEHNRKAEYSSALSQLFVAMTRAEESVIIDSSAHYKKISQYVKDAIRGTENHHDAQRSVTHSESSSQADWMKRAVVFIKDGMAERGKLILRQELQLSDVEINSLLQKHSIPASYVREQQVPRSEPFVAFKPTKVPKRASRLESEELLFLAARKGKLSRVKSLLEEISTFDIDRCQGPGKYQGQTALFIASANAHVEIVNVLITAGAKVNNRQGEGSQRGKTALLAASSCKCVGVVEVLINAGADIDLAQKYGPYAGCTPITIASMKGNAEVVDALIMGGAKVDLMRVGRQHCTALFEASFGGVVAMVKILIKVGAKIDLAQGHGPFKGWTALLAASANGKMDVVEVLTKAGAEIDLMSERERGGKCTSLFAASDAGYVEAVEVLIKAGAEVDLMQKSGPIKGCTALFTASSNGNVEVVDALINAGAEVNLLHGSGPFEGCTALFTASSNGNVKVVEVLIEAGAEVNLVQGSEPFKGKTAFDISGETIKRMLENVVIAERFTSKVIALDSIKKLENNVEYFNKVKYQVRFYLYLCLSKDEPIINLYQKLVKGITDMQDRTPCMMAELTQSEAALYEHRATQALRRVYVRHVQGEFESASKLAESAPADESSERKKSKKRRKRG